MKAMMNLMWLGLATLLFAACGEDTPADTDTGVEQESDTNVDTTTVTPLDKLLDKAYYIQLDKQYWNKPNNYVGNDIGGRVPPFVFKFTSITPTDAAGNGTFTALFGIGNENGTQDLCNKTYEVSGVLSSPAGGSTTFQFNPIDLSMIIEGNDEDSDGIPTALIAPVYNFSIGGTFVNQGARFKLGTINAVLDSRTVACMFTVLTDPTPDNFCTRMSSDFGHNCEACSYTGGDSQAYCVTLGAEAFKIDEVVGLAVAPVADFDQTCIIDTCTNAK